MLHKIIIKQLQEHEKKLPVAEHVNTETNHLTKPQTPAFKALLPGCQMAESQFRLLLMCQPQQSLQRYHVRCLHRMWRTKVRSPGDKLWTYIIPHEILVIHIYMVHPPLNIHHMYTCTLTRSTNPPLQLTDLFVFVIFLILHFSEYLQEAVHFSLSFPRILSVAGHFLFEVPNALSQLSVGLSFQRCILSLMENKGCSLDISGHVRYLKLYLMYLYLIRI